MGGGRSRDCRFSPLEKNALQVKWKHRQVLHAASLLAPAGRRSTHTVPPYSATEEVPAVGRLSALTSMENPMEMDLDDLTVRYAQRLCRVTACYPLTRYSSLCIDVSCLVDADRVALCRLHPSLLLSADTKARLTLLFGRNTASPLGLSSQSRRYTRRTACVHDNVFRTTAVDHELCPRSTEYQDQSSCWPGGWLHRKQNRRSAGTNRAQHQSTSTRGSSRYY